MKTMQSGVGSLCEKLLDLRSKEQNKDKLYYCLAA